MVNKLTMKSLQSEISKIKKRNKKVEADKAWEVSVMRKWIITATTFVSAAIFMYILGMSDIIQTAFLAALFYLLSTLSIGFFKTKYIEKYIKK